MNVHVNTADISVERVIVEGGADLVDGRLGVNSDGAHFDSSAGAFFYLSKVVVVGWYRSVFQG